MESQNQPKNLVRVVSQSIKNNLSSIAIGLGIALTGVTIAWKLYSRRVHPDIKKVLWLRETIQKSYLNAMQTLKTLNIERSILTQYRKNENSHQVDMVYLLMTRLRQKQKNKQHQLRNPFLPPFEDGLYITELEPTHRLVYNKFNIFKNHLIVVTKQFQSQTNQITEADFKQTILTMKALEGLLFFNGGKEAGASQSHKHLQVFPAEALQLPIIKQIIEFVRKQRMNAQNHKIIQFPRYNFLHGLIILQPQISLNASKREIYKAYKQLLEHTIRKIGVSSYNLIATDEFVVVIPRRKERAFDQISVNSVGFMGSVLFKDQQKLNKYLSLKIKPTNILQDITYPKDYKPIDEGEKN